MKVSDLKTRQVAPLLTPTDLGPTATRDVAAALNLLLAARTTNSLLPPCARVTRSATSITMSPAQAN